MTISLKTYEFHEIDQYMEYISKYQDSRVVQLQPGCFLHKEAMLEFDDFMVFQFTSGQKLLDRFSIPPGYLEFFITSPAVENCIWCGVEIQPDSLVVIHPGQEYLVLLPPGYQALGILIKTDMVLRERLLPDALWQRTFEPEKAFFRHESSRIVHFRNRLERLFLSATDLQQPLNHGLTALALKNWVVDELQTIFLDIEIGQNPGRPLPKMAVNKRFRIFSRTTEVIEEQLTESFSIQQLADEIGITPRTLQLCFKEIVGISPGQYITTRKLHAVRQQLCESQNLQRSISHLAQDFGFQHASRFASQYKAMFHELPSSTLKRKRRAIKK